MRPLQRLQRLSDYLTEFGWIKDNPGALTATKKLMRDLRQDKVNIVRGPRFSYSRGAEIQRQRGADNPIAGLWHEAGHHADRFASIDRAFPEGHVDDPLVRAQKRWDVKRLRGGASTKELARLKVRLNPSFWGQRPGVLGDERAANKNALAKMREYGVPKEQKARYIAAVAPWYKTYVKESPSPRRRLP